MGKRSRARFGARIFSTCVVVVALAGCGWPQFRGDAAHTGYQPFEWTINSANVSSLTEAWTATGPPFVREPTVANGVSYVGSYVGTSGLLSAYDATGVTGCSGIPKTCTPLWTAAVGYHIGSAAVTNGVVYMASYGTLGGKLEAFDAAGVTGCSGLPKTCTPLWTAPLAGNTAESPAVANGVVYVDSGYLQAFDAAGLTGCSGAPKTCEPLWTAIYTGFSSSPAIANGVVYIARADTLFAFDAAGVTGCSGIPAYCAALWTATGVHDQSSPVAGNGFVYTVDRGTPNLTIKVFDAAGVTGCSGVPKTCGPLWTATVGGLTGYAGPPAVANGVIYIATGGAATDRLQAFDATGVTGCSGVPKTCTPLWTAPVANAFPASPTVANGVVYIVSNGTSTSQLLAFDAAGVTGCSGVPKTCTPLLTTPAGGAAFSPVVANGVVYLATQDLPVTAMGGKLRAYKP